MVKKILVIFLLSLSYLTIKTTNIDLTLPVLKKDNIENDIAEKVYKCT